MPPPVLLRHALAALLALVAALALVVFGNAGLGLAQTDTDPPGLATATPPSLAADGKTLTITYDEAMKTDSTPASTAFTVKATPDQGSEETVAVATTGGVSVSGSTVVLTLSRPLAHNDGSVKVSYAKPSTDPVLEDTAGNDAPDFTDEAVTNNSAIPRVSIRAVHADTSPLIALPSFELTRTGGTS